MTPHTSGLVAVVIPVSPHPHLTPDEEISLRHLEHYLGRYDRYFIAPHGSQWRRAGYETVTFPRRFFGSVRAHARLQLHEAFYAQFAAYRYLLMYHLDALVFADELERWCGTNVDYIGAPWLPCADSPWVATPQVGNGGFALIKVESFLTVLRSTRPSEDPAESWRAFCAGRRWPVRALNLPRKYLKRLRAFNGVRWETRWWPYRSLGNSDYFWAIEAAKYWPDFTVASVDEGLAFAFEVAPRWCFERNGRRLPFGCHAWPRYDRAFWEPYLLR